VTDQGLKPITSAAQAPPLTSRYCANLRPTKSVDRSIPEHPAQMTARLKFKKLRFQMIGNRNPSTIAMNPNSSPNRRLQDGNRGHASGQPQTHTRQHQRQKGVQLDDQNQEQQKSDGGNRQQQKSHLDHLASIPSGAIPRDHHDHEVAWLL